MHQYQIGAADFAEWYAGRDYYFVAFFNNAGFQSQLLRLLDQLVGGSGSGRHYGRDTPIE